jgi:hypothetical protein
MEQHPAKNSLGFVHMGEYLVVDIVHPFRLATIIRSEVSAL